MHRHSLPQLLSLFHLGWTSSWRTLRPGTHTWGDWRSFTPNSQSVLPSCRVCHRGNLQPLLPTRCWGGTEVPGLSEGALAGWCLCLPKWWWALQAFRGEGSYYTAPTQSQGSTGSPITCARGWAGKVVLGNSLRFCISPDAGRRPKVTGQPDFSSKVKKDVEVERVAPSFTSGLLYALHCLLEKSPFAFLGGWLALIFDIAIERSLLSDCWSHHV